MKNYSKILLLISFFLTTVSDTWGIVNNGGNYPILLPSGNHPEASRGFNNQEEQTSKDYNVLPENPLIHNPPPVETFTQHDYNLPHAGVVVGASGPSDSPEISNGIQIEMSSTNLTGSAGQVIYFLVKNVGKEDEYIHINISGEKGYVKEVPATPFYLPSGSSKEMSVRMIYPPEIPPGSPDLITINAKGKRNTVKRSAYYYPGNEYDSQQYGQPFCYDRYVTGSCRYRSDPYECDQYKWTAYATIQNAGGIQQLRSFPEGLYVPTEFYPGTTERVRVYLTVSCCIPIVQFISINPYNPFAGNACVVDVRELQGLNAAEIAGIVVGAVILVIIIIVVIALLIRRRRKRTILVGHHTAKTTRERVTRE